MKGVDISYAQGVVNFDQLKTAVDFVIIRAGYTNGADIQFKRNQNEARRVGLRRGYYWFTYPSRIGSAQADADEFVNTVGALQDGEFLVLDYEVGEGSPQYCRDFLDRVYARTGVKPFLYTNQNRTVTLDWAPVRNGGYPLWVAIYDNDPYDKENTNGWSYLMNQYTADGRVAGIAGAVDLDYASDDPAKYGKGEGNMYFTEAEIKSIVRGYTGNYPGSGFDMAHFTKTPVSQSLVDQLCQELAPYNEKRIQASINLQKALDDANKKLAAANQPTVQLDPATKAQIDQTNQNTNWLVATIKKIFNIGG